eukprot:CAMPEP_0114554940 /NCGR_PEP_ID=MMETSP0114-20121206/8479_1 /TAXON_ID=31324 /ORGANISM="Goniomonas sp, Strain m" /LENGTH=161 /DNA_ID=CAMNT_0001740023 /DNA_START=88 /DNA_END=573 /DNA_ORIENTATION=+
MKPHKKKVRLESSQMQELKEAFILFDTDGSGAIDAKELLAAVRSLGVSLTPSQVQGMIKEYDKDMTGEIDFNEFKEMMGGFMVQKNTKEEVCLVFKALDRDNTGVLTLSNLRAVAAEMHASGVYSFAEKDLMNMMLEADHDGDGYVTQEEFLTLMHKTGNC